MPKGAPPISEAALEGVINDRGVPREVRAVVVAAARSGARVGDILCLRTGSLWWENRREGVVACEWGVDKTAIVSQRELGLIYLEDKDEELLGTYISGSPPTRPQRERAPLFPGIETRTVTAALRRWDPSAGAHSLRKRFAERAFAQRAPATAVSSALRHRRSETIGSYQGNSIRQEARKALEACLGR